MATTTNYGWTTPDDTGLVKDGASAIRTLGSSVDTTTKALNPSTTLGDIEYRSSTANTNTRLPIGTTGQVLSVSGGVPAWATPSNGMTLISETVASALSSLSFTSLGSYKQLLLMYSGIRHSNNSTYFSVRFNNDSTSVYYVGGLQQVGATTDLGMTARDSLSGTAGGSTIFPFGGQASNAALATDVMGSILIDNYTSSTKFKTITSSFHYYAAADAANVNMNTVHMYGNTTAITSLDIVRLSGAGTFSNSTNTTIRLYGIS
jgi:hypothetical protein